MTAAIVARVGVPTSRRSRSPARAVPGQSDATRGSGLRPRDLIPLARRGPPAGRRPTAQTTTSSILLSTSPSCTSATTSSSCSSATSSSCSSTTSSSTPLAPAGAATSCSGDGDVLPTVKVGWPAARAAGRGCAAGVLDLYYYSIPGGVAALAAAHLAPPALGWRRRWARGALAPRVRIATQHPYSRGLRACAPGVLGTRRVCVQGRRPHPTLTTRLDDGASPVPQPWPPTGLRLWL